LHIEGSNLIIKTSAYWLITELLLEKPDKKKTSAIPVTTPPPKRERGVR
jgi:hypothetical protein